MSKTRAVQSISVLLAVVLAVLALAHLGEPSTSLAAVKAARLTPPVQPTTCRKNYGGAESLAGPPGDCFGREGSRRGPSVDQGQPQPSPTPTTQPPSSSGSGAFTTPPPQPVPTAPTPTSPATTSPLGHPGSSGMVGMSAAGWKQPEPLDPSRFPPELDDLGLFDATPAPSMIAPDVLARYERGSVDMAFRELVWTELDAEYPGIVSTSDLELSRRYFGRLDASVNGFGGPGWVFSFFERIEVISGTELLHQSSEQPFNSPAYYYTQSTATQYDAPPEVGAHIIVDTNSVFAYYRVHFKSGSIHDFDSSGRLTKRHDAYGNTVSFEYDHDQCDVPSEITDSRGKTFAISCNDLQLVTAITDPLGNTTTYSYADGLLEQVTYPEREVYYFDPPGFTAPTTFRTTTRSYTYNASGKLEQVLNDLGGLVMGVTYDSSNPDKVASQTNAHGGVFVFQEATLATGYMVTQITPRGFKQEFVYDANHQLTQLREYMVSTIQQTPSRTVPNGHPGYYQWAFGYNGCTCGMLTSVTEPDGGKFELIYDASYNILNVVKHANGGAASSLVWSWTYDSQHRMTSYLPPEGFAAATPADHTVTYSYVADTDPSNPGGEVQTVTIPARSWRKDLALPASTWVTRVDTAGRIVDRTGPAVNKGSSGFYEAFTYYPPGSAQSCMPKKRFTTTDLVRWTEYEWNKNGRLTSATRNTGERWEQDYDSQNQPTQWRAPIENGQQYKHAWKWDGEGNVSQIRYTYFADSSVSTPTWITWDSKYNAANQVLKTEKDLTTTIRATTTRTYDTHGNVIEVVDPDGRKESALYDERDLPWVLKDGVGTADEAVRTAHYRDDGELAKVEEPLDTRTVDVEYFYDQYDRMNRIEIPGKVKGEIDYDDGSRPTEMREYGLVGSSFALIKKTVFDYDDWHPNPTKNTIYVYDENGTSLLRTAVYELFYSAAGKLAIFTKGGPSLGSQQIISCFEYTPWGRPLSAFDAHGNREDFTYNSITGHLERHKIRNANTQPGGTALVMERTFETDDVGRVTKITRKAPGKVDEVELFDYDSADNVAAVTDASGLTHRYTYRFDGVPTSKEMVIDATQSATRLVQSIYSKAGHLTAETDDRGNTITYSYDGRGRRIQEMHPDSTYWEWSYNDASLPVTMKTPDGRQVDYVYDDLGNVSSRCFCIVSNPLQILRQDTLTWSPTGFLKSIAKSEGGLNSTVSYTRDGDGNVLTENQDGNVVQYDRDALGRVTTLTSPSGQKRIYTYNDRDQIVSIKDGMSNTVATFTHVGPGDSISTRTTGDGSKLTISRNGFGRVEVMESIRPDLSVFAKFVYDYDARGLPKSEDRPYTINGGYGNKGDAYLFDGMGRLRKMIRDSANAPNVNWSNPSAISHTYHRDFQLSDDHHRTALVTTPFGSGPQTTPYTVAGNSDHYTNVGGVSRTYDTQGNLTSHGTREFIYDNLDALVCVKDNAQVTATFTYDALGRRITKTANGVTTRYVYAGALLVEEYRQAGQAPEALDAVHFHATGIDEVVMSRRVDRADIDGDQNTTELVDLYLHTNQLGSVMEVTALINGVITVVESYRYEAYGAPTVYDGSGSVVGATVIGNPLLFTGREYDPEVGLYYYRLRTYDPLHGQFLQEDPLGSLDDINLLAYALSNPLVFTDPMGTLSIGQAVQSLLNLAAKHKDILGSALNVVLGELIDILSAVSGRDISGWLAGGLSGAPQSLGWWARAKLAASGAFRLLGSAFGAIKKVKDAIALINKIANKAAKKAAAAAKRAASKVKNKAKAGCLAAGTIVWLAGGERIAIEEIEVGATLSAAGRENGACDRTSVAALLTWTTEIEISGPNGVRDYLRGTEDHPVWSTSRGCWVPLRHLRVGESLEAAQHCVTVVAITREFTPVLVHNLAVDPHNEFLVGRFGVRTHNNPCMTPDQRALKDLVNEVTLRGRKPLTAADRDIVIQWAKETKYPGFRAKPGDLAKEGNHWVGGPHIHLPGAGRGGHVPVDGR